MRLIDADKFTQEMKNRQTAVSVSVEHPITDRYFTDKEHWEGVLLTFVEAKLTMDNMPTVDAVPVKHGRWKGNETCDAYDIAGAKTWAVKRKCSICGFTHKFIEAHMYYEFCPNCGAKMDLEEQHE